MNYPRSKTSVSVNKSESHIWVNLEEVFDGLETPINASVHRVIEITPTRARELANELLKLADEIESKAE